jgi:hypothetical protein
MPCRNYCGVSVYSDSVTVRIQTCLIQYGAPIFITMGTEGRHWTLS